LHTPVTTHLMNQMKTIQKIPALLYFSLACLYLSAQNSENIYVKGNDYEGIIFNYDKKRYNSNYINGFFTPTIAEIKIVEKALKEQLENLNKFQVNRIIENPIIHENLDNYRRQYYGYIDKNGFKIIYINCFWKYTKHQDWQSKFIGVDDGGSYYWQVKFHIEENRLFNLTINGNA